MEFIKQVGNAVAGFSVGASSLVKAAATGVTTAAFTVSSIKSSLSNKNRQDRQPKKSAEVIQMKKSTVIALFAALAAVAGVLGALYVYVLRREKELDEYEQLLFSEEFGDDELDEDLDALLASADAEAE